MSQAGPSAPIPDPYAQPAPARRSGTSGAAVGALLSALCLPALGGVLAIALGLGARSKQEREGGGDKTVVNAAIALGVVNLLASTAGLAAFVILLGKVAAPSPATPGTAPPPPSTPPIATRGPLAPAPPTAAPGPGKTTTRSGGIARSTDTSTVETEVGTITLVDVGTDVPSLDSELTRQREASKRAGERFVLWTVSRDCKPCNGVAAALPDARMQRALGKTRLVRVDVHDFGVELARLNVPIDVIPGFSRLGNTNRPVDYVHGGEWDADIAENIAPVLEKFVRGSYKQRRHPWKGGRREDETTI